MRPQTLLQTLFLASVVTTAASTARAQSTEVPPPPPPANGASTSGFSLVNGHPIPVGDRNRYEFAHRRWNLSTNPLGWALGSYGASASYAFHSNFAVRADLNYYDPVGDGDESGFEAGLGAPIYFRKAYSGLFLEPGILLRRLSVGESSTTTVGPNVNIGYHWLWDSGLNVALAAGVGRNWASKDSQEFDEVFFSGYLRFGYAF